MDKKNDFYLLWFDKQTKQQMGFFRLPLTFNEVKKVFSLADDEFRDCLTIYASQAAWLEEQTGLHLNFFKYDHFLQMNYQGAK
jgi:hypothetical protein